MARHQTTLGDKKIDTQRSRDLEDVNGITDNTHFMSLEIDLKAEQYRLARVERSDDSYVYLPIPIPISQRKQLSEYLLNFINIT